MGYGDVLSNIGGFGVDLFFMLSAYLITELLMRERSGLGGWTCVRFTFGAS
jgi:peptidoglycan/LPS O-acetylase OafA/YrhL